MNIKSGSGLRTDPSHSLKFRGQESEDDPIKETWEE